MLPQPRETIQIAIPSAIRKIDGVRYFDIGNAQCLGLFDRRRFYLMELSIGSSGSFSQYDIENIQAVVPIIKGYILITTRDRKLWLLEVKKREKTENETQKLNQDLYIQSYFLKQFAYQAYFLREVTMHMFELQIYASSKTHNFLIYQFTVHEKFGTIVSTIDTNEKICKHTTNQLYGSKKFYNPACSTILKFKNFSDSQLHKKKVAPQPLFVFPMPKNEEYYGLSDSGCMFELDNPGSKKKIKLLQSYNLAKAQAYMNYLLIEHLSSPFATLFCVEKMEMKLVTSINKSFTWGVCGNGVLAGVSHDSQFISVSGELRKEFGFSKIKQGILPSSLQITQNQVDHLLSKSKEIAQNTGMGSTGMGSMNMRSIGMGSMNTGSIGMENMSMRNTKNTQNQHVEKGEIMIEPEKNFFKPTKIICRNKTVILKEPQVGHATKQREALHQCIEPTSGKKGEETVASKLQLQRQELVQSNTQPFKSQSTKTETNKLAPTSNISNEGEKITDEVAKPANINNHKQINQSVDKLQQANVDQGTKMHDCKQMPKVSISAPHISQTPDPSLLLMPQMPVMSMPLRSQMPLQSPQHEWLKQSQGSMVGEQSKQQRQTKNLKIPSNLQQIFYKFCTNRTQPLPNPPPFDKSQPQTKEFFKHKVQASTLQTSNNPPLCGNPVQTSNKPPLSNNNPPLSSNPVQTSNNPPLSSNPVQTSNNPPLSSNNPPQSSNPFRTSSNPPQSSNPFQTSKNPPQSGNPFQTSNNPPLSSNNPPQSSNPFQTSKNPPQSGNPFQTSNNPPLSGNPVQTGNNQSQCVNSSSTLTHPFCTDSKGESKSISCLDISGSLMSVRSSKLKTGEDEQNRTASDEQQISQSNLAQVEGIVDNYQRELDKLGEAVNRLETRIQTDMQSLAGEVSRSVSLQPGELAGELTGELQKTVENSICSYMKNKLTAKVDKYFKTVMNDTSKIFEETVKFYGKQKEQSVNHSQKNFGEQEYLIHEVRQISGTLMASIQSTVDEGEEGHALLLKEWDSTVIPLSHKLDQNFEMILGYETGKSAAQRENMMQSLSDIKELLNNQIELKRKEEQQRFSSRADRPRKRKRADRVRKGKQSKLPSREKHESYTSRQNDH